MDTLEDIAREEYNEKHLFMCGTCHYRKKNRCTNWDSDCVHGIVDEECSCSEYRPAKGLRLL